MEKLGIQLPLLITQIINFSIVLFVLSKFLYKPILKMLDERKQKIEDGLAWSEKAKQEEEKLLQKKQELLREARDEAKVIIDNAKKDGKRVKDEYLTDGKKELASLREKQMKEMEAKLNELSEQLTAQTVDIAAAMIKQILPQLLSEADQHKLVVEQLRRVAASHEKR